MPTAMELRLPGSDHLLGRLVLEDVLHPGRWWEPQGRSFLTLQRRHRYSLRQRRPAGAPSAAAGRRSLVIWALGDRVIPAAGPMPIHCCCDAQFCLKGSSTTCSL